MSVMLSAIVLSVSRVQTKTPNRIPVATALWAVYQALLSHQEDGPQGRGYSGFGSILNRSNYIERFLYKQKPRRTLPTGL